MTPVQTIDGHVEWRQGSSVEPVLLQVVCHLLWQRRQDSSAIRLADLKQVSKVAVVEDPSLGSVDRALMQFYDQAVADVVHSPGMQVSERVLRRWVQHHLITEQGLRGQVPLSEGTTRGIVNQALDRLVDTHVLHRASDGGTYRYELGHGRLIQPVLHSNDAWLKRNLTPFQLQAELWARNPSDDLLARGTTLAEGERLATAGALLEDDKRFLHASRQARTMARLQFSLLALIAVIILLVGVFVARDVAERMEQQQLLTKTAENNAEVALKIAESNQKRAEKSEELVLREQEEAAKRFALLNLIQSLRGNGSIAGNESDILDLLKSEHFLSSLPVPTTKMLANLAARCTEDDLESNILIAVGAVFALEQRANNATQEAELNNVIEELERIEKQTTNQQIAKRARLVRLRAVNRLSVLRGARIFFQLSPTAQFGLLALDRESKSFALTYDSEGNTNLTTLRIDKKRVVFGSNQGEWIRRREFLDPGPNKTARLGIQSQWLFRESPLKVTQILEIVRSSDKGPPDTCLVGYVITNTGKEKLEISFNVIIDTMIGKVDDNFFAFPTVDGSGKYVRHTRVFAQRKLRQLDYVKASEDADREQRDRTAYFSLMWGKGLEPPTRFVIQNWDDLHNPDADLPGYDHPERMGKEWKDSAVSICWSGLSLGPGESRMLAYAYGLGKVSVESLRSQYPQILELAAKRR
jgi:hypothetical protein